MRNALALVAILLCGCGGPERDRERRPDNREPERWLDGRVHEAMPEGMPVDVYVTQRPTRPYREIAIIRIDSDDSGAATTRRLRQRTREMGGDACIVTARGVQHHGMFFLIALGLGSNGGDTTEAVVVSYTTDGQR